MVKVSYFKEKFTGIIPEEAEKALNKAGYFLGSFIPSDYVRIKNENDGWDYVPINGNALSLQFFSIMGYIKSCFVP